jgi:hypothetical protein
MAVGFSNTNKPLNPRGQDASPKGYNRASLFSGKALDFDGVNDEVNCGDGSALDFGTGNFSFSLYVKINSAQSSLQNIFSKKDAAAATAGYSIFYNHSTGKLLFSNANGTSASEIFSADSFTEYEDKWIHLVAVRDSSDDKNAYFYINAVKHELASTLTIYDTDNSYDFKIGNTHTGAYFNNQQVAGLKAFDVALTAAQVADLYNNPEKVVPTGVDNTALKLWLPMMEGAGTTAYDGSGNGNHGTISGATYVNGIGAPVAQSAVIDWNKGQNVINKSESFLTTYYSNQNITVTADQITAPDGDDNGYKFVASNANTFHLCNHSATVSAGVYTQSIFAKAGGYEHIYVVLRTDGGTKRYGVKFDLSDGTFVDDMSYGSPTNTSYAISDAGNDWYRCSVTSNHTSGQIIAVFGPSIGGSISDINNTFQGDGTSGIYAWGLQAEIATSVGAYIPNPSETRITSDVLLPQGLTTGRDITGVNLFENVRKQGALNLDGNSWAEVHDNASVDLTTGATLECWYKWGTQLNAGLLGRWDYPNNQRSLLILHGALDNARLLFSFDGTNAAAVEGTSTPADGTWVHIAGTYDGTTFRLYVNATQEATASSTGVLFNSPDSVEIGRHGYGALDETNGSIAQPRIYNRALTASEVLRNYNSGKNTYTND